MLDVSDVQQDVAEHFGVVGSSIIGGFRGRSGPEQQHLLPGSSEDREYHRKSSSIQYGSTESVPHLSQNKPTTSSSPYRIKDKKISSESEHNSDSTLEKCSSTASSTRKSGQSGTNENSYLGLNVQGPSTDSINYQNPNV